MGFIKRWQLRRLKKQNDRMEREIAAMEKETLRLKQIAESRKEKEKTEVEYKSWRHYNRLTQDQKPGREETEDYRISMMYAVKERQQRWNRRRMERGEPTIMGELLAVAGTVIADKLGQKLRPHEQRIKEANDYADIAQKVATVIQTTGNTDEMTKILEAEKLQQETRRTRAQADVEEENARFTIDDLRRLKKNK